MTTTATFNGHAHGALTILNSDDHEAVMRAHRRSLNEDKVQALVPRDKDYIKAHLAGENGHAAVGVWDQTDKALTGLAFFHRNEDGKSCALQGLWLPNSTTALRDELIDTWRTHAAGQGCERVVARCKAGGNIGAIVTFLKRNLHISSFDNGRARPVYNLQGPVVLHHGFAAAAFHRQEVGLDQYNVQEDLLRQGYRGTAIAGGKMVLDRPLVLAAAA